MIAKKIKPTSIEEYIDAAPADVQAKLRQLQTCIRKTAPGAKESLKWGMPAFSYQKILVTFAVFKNHIGFYPMPSAIKAFAKDLEKYKTASGSLIINSSIAYNTGSTIGTTSTKWPDASPFYRFENRIKTFR